MFQSEPMTVYWGGQHKETGRPDYRYRQYTVKHNSISDFIMVYFLHRFVQRHVSALVMSLTKKSNQPEGGS